MSGYRQRRKVWKDVTRTLLLATGDTPTTVGADFIVGPAKHTIYVQKIVVHVKTAAAQVLSFQDDASSPLVLAVLPASAAVGDQHLLLDSEEGVPCTEGKNFEIVGAAGVGATIIVQAYLRPTGTRTIAQA